MLTDNHISLTTSLDIDKLCFPLKDFFGISYFQFRRTYNDRSRAILSNRPKLIKLYYDTKRYDTYGTFENQEQDINMHHEVFGLPNNDTYCTKKSSDSRIVSDGFVLWHTLGEKQVYSDIFKDCYIHNIANGITYAKKGDGFCTFYHFGTTISNIKAINKYMSNLDLLKRFVYYFEQEADELIKKSEKQKILPLTKMQCVNTINHNSKFVSELSRQRFIKNTKIKNYYLNQSKTLHLTNQQFRCAKELIKGRSSKKIGQHLNLSHRTIEGIIGAMKNKCNFTCKSDLITLLLNSDNSYLLQD